MSKKFIERDIVMTIESLNMYKWKYEIGIYKLPKDFTSENSPIPTEPKPVLYLIIGKKTQHDDFV